MTDQQNRQTGSLENSTSTQTVESIDLMELMYRLLGNWKLIISLMLILAVAFGLYTSFFVTPLYSATSTIYVLSRRDSVISMSDLQIGTALTSDYIKVFKMWEVHEEVISNLNLPYSYKQMQQMLTVANDNGTRMLDITVSSPSPQEAMEVANEYAKVASQYIADTMSTDKPNIMSVALLPTNAVSPNKTRSVMLGALLGFVLGAGFVTLRMITDDTYKTAEDIRKYAGLATLAVVPIDESEAGRNNKNGKKGKKQWKR